MAACAILRASLYLIHLLPACTGSIHTFDLVKVRILCFKRAAGATE